MTIPTIEEKDLLSKLKKDPEAIYMAAGDCGFRHPPPHVIEAYKKALDELRYQHYGHQRGEPELRQAFAEKLEKENAIDADPETNILITSGARGGFYGTIQALIGAGDEVITMDPSYEGTFWDVDFVGAKCVSVPLREQNKFRLIPEEIEKRITQKTKMIININPENPTGRVYTREELESVAEIAKKHNLVVLSDEVYEHVVYDGRKHISFATLPDMKDRTVTLFSLKDTGCSGWRVGFTVANKEIINMIYEVNRRSCAHPNLPAQIASIAALEDRDYLKDWLREYDALRKVAVQELNKISGVTCHMPEGGYVVLPNISKLGKSVDIWKFLIEKAKVGTNPATWFGKLGEGYIRIVQCQLRMQGLKEALRRIKEALETLS